MNINVELVKKYNEVELPLDGNLIIQKGNGHTEGVSDLEEVHPGRNSAVAYTAGRLTGRINSSAGLSILHEIKKLQVGDTESAFYGCFRWYREETRVYDTNAAFFTLEPLIVCLLRAPEVITSQEKTIIIDMLEASSEWFLHECSNPILFYTNKIISDGAMMGAIGRLTENRKIIEKAHGFYEKWLDYTEERGYGWGENISLGYNSVILRAFSIILSTVGDDSLAERFRKQEKFILDIFRFHNGYEFVPTIRSYNVAGDPSPWSIAYNLAGVRGFGYLDSEESPVNKDVDNIGRLIVDTMIFRNRLYSTYEEYVKKGLSNPVLVPRVSNVRIMDDKQSYSWIGGSGGIGSINEFPVIDGSYQHKGWGLGWQCFPVSSVVYGHGVSFLRFYVDDGKRIRCHPHKNKHDTYLDPALFSESGYPDVRTTCYQNGPSLVAIRSMSGLGNNAREISDRMDFPGFDGTVFEREASGRQWFVICYDTASIIITSLLGNPAEGGGTGEDYRGRPYKTVSMTAEIVHESDMLGIRQTLYKGENKTHHDSRISCSWFMHYHDTKLNEDEIVSWLNRIELIEDSSPDGEIPRMPEWNIHNISVNFDEKPVLEIKHDPYK